VELILAKMVPDVELYQTFLICQKKRNINPDYKKFDALEKF